MIAIGVDPGKNTGIAVWDCEKQKIIELKTMSFWQAYNHVAVNWKAKADRLLVRVEDPSGNSPVWHGSGKSKGVQAKIAQRVGRNKQMADLLIEGYRQAGLVVQPVVPKSSKWTHKMFKKITGYKGRSNEHNRDAARMVVGLRAMPPEQFNQLTKTQ